MTCDEIYDRITLMVRRLMASSTIETVQANAVTLIEKALGAVLKDDSRTTLAETIQTTPLSLMRVGLLTMLGGVLSAMMRPIEAKAWQAYFMTRSEHEAYTEHAGLGHGLDYEPEEFGKEWFGCDEDEDSGNDDGGQWLN